MGPYGWAGQYQQRPEPKGGAIFQREWWQYQETHGDRLLPPGIGFDYIIASLDTAYTLKEQNDYSALTVWGTFRDFGNEPKVMLIDAWQKRLEIHGAGTERSKGEGDGIWFRRNASEWGLTEWVAYTCRTRRVDRLLIEAKSAGISVAQELRRLYGSEGFGIDLIDPRGDKVARANSVVPLFSDGYVCVPAAPDGDNLIPLDFADLVINQAAFFPRGAHDDLVDSMVQALRHMRDYGFAIRREEYKHDFEESLKYKPKSAPLYPV